MQVSSSSYDIPNLVDLQPEAAVSLGNVLLWVADRIASDGQSVPDVWDQAMAELIERCAGGKLIASGALESHPDRNLETIPQKDWRIDKGVEGRILTVSTVDLSLGSELGGVVSISYPGSIVSRKEWVGVGVPVGQVLKAWSSLLSQEERLSIRRRDILSAARSGELAPDAAELHARAEGLGALAYTPDVAEFDPFKNSDWTLEMTLAWIMRRTADDVRRYWSEYQSRVWNWVEVLEPEERNGKRAWIKGFRLAQGRLSAFTLQHSVALEDAGRADGRVTSPRALHDYEGARIELFAKLSGGEITGTARIEGGADRFDLLPAEWEDIRIPLANPAQGNDRLRLLQAKSGAELLEVLVPSAKVVELWPSLNPLPRSVEKPEHQASIIERIRERGGLQSLSPTEQQIWEAIQTAGGEDALPNRPRDYIKKIQDHAKGAAPSRSSIDRFFGRFRVSDGQA